MTEKSKLISTVIDREDRPEDWTALDAVASRDPGIWRDLLFALRDDADVRHAVAPHLAVADRVMLAFPTSFAPAPAPALARNGWGTATLWAATGWLAAVVLGVLWLGSSLLEESVDLPLPKPGLNGGTPARLVVAPDTRPEQWQSQQKHPQQNEHQLVAPASVLGDLPNLMVQARLIDGSDEVEVFFVRRTLERAMVKKAYLLTVDESGQPFTMAADLSAYMPPRIY